MQQNATDPEHSGHELSQPQVKALSQLGGGATITAAAKTAGVDRTTVHRWLREDATFQAARNRLHADMRREAAARLDHLAETALSTLQNALEAGDARAAIAILKGAGMLDGQRPTIGPEEPDAVREEAALARREAEAILRTRRMLAF